MSLSRPRAQAKETVGGVTGDKKMENEGKGQNIGGKVCVAVGGAILLSNLATPH